MRRTDEMWCQLFSEPDSGSDLASIHTRADHDKTGWLLNGQKVWTSGAQYADFGYILCRTDFSAPKHRGLTAFILPMTTPGVTVRPLRQMTGGSSFNEVFLVDVHLPDSARLGPRGEGWRVALTTLGFERATSLQASGAGSSPYERLVALAQHLGRSDDAIVRQQLAALYIQTRIQGWTRHRASQRLKAGDTPGPEGSVGKLQWTEGLRVISQVASVLLGPHLAADTGEWGTFAWSEFVTGVPGYRIAGGTDEIQRNIIAERVLGLPRELQIDHHVPPSDFGLE